jgi:hypothetical protein
LTEQEEENYKGRSLVVCTYDTLHCFANRLEEDEIGGACVKHARDTKHKHNFGWKFQRTLFPCLKQLGSEAV